MAKAVRARETRCGSLPEEIVVWEILVRLPPKPLLRCRAVCRAWRHITSTREFVLAHHGLQPSLRTIHRSLHYGQNTKSILAFDHQAAPGDQLQHVAELDGNFDLEASCDGLLVLSQDGWCDTSYMVCNPATRQHAPLSLPPNCELWGMYLHRPTGDHRLLLHLSMHLPPEGRHGCYVFTLGSEKTKPRYVGGPEIVYSTAPALLRNSLHWLLRQHQDENRLVCVFDTTTESFREMRAPLVPTESYIFDMDGTLGIYGCSKTKDVVNIWALHNYEDEVWKHRYHVELPVAEIRRELRATEEVWTTGVVSMDGDIIVLVSHGGRMLYVDNNGELIVNINRGGQDLRDCGFRLKQSLVQQTFFPAIEGYGVNSFPFV